MSFESNNKKDFNLSYWDKELLFKPRDIIIVGGGIVGLSTAISFKKRHKKASILIIERGLIADGASMKNAGFACFGSAGELLSDLGIINESTVWETVEMRWKGLQLLRKRLGDKNMNYKAYGGFELFETQHSFQNVNSRLTGLNRNIAANLGLKSCFEVTKRMGDHFGKVCGIVKNRYEGQLDTALMMHNLRKIAIGSGIDVLNNINIIQVTETGSGHVILHSEPGDFVASKAVICTNGFANEILPLDNLKPARGQVLITSPIRNLKIKGAFHMKGGFYYFRNVGNRLLFGGGREIDFEGETTSVPGLNTAIQGKLDLMLKEIILPAHDYEIEQRWSGIMGVGPEKKPIIKKIGKNILAAVRMGGMGVAIGSLVGELAANEMS